MNDEKKAGLENLRTQYKEVCQNHRAVTDFRGKLLTLLPLASGVGIYVLLPKEADPANVAPGYLIAIGLFGVLVALGLFFHELKGIRQCTDLIKVGRVLEEKMELPEGQFIREDNDSRFVNNLVGPVGAAWIIYPSVVVAWGFVAVLGFVKLCA
jgi:hypothetical protein